VSKGKRRPANAQGVVLHDFSRLWTFRDTGFSLSENCRRCPTPLLTWNIAGIVIAHVVNKENALEKFEFTETATGDRHVGFQPE